MPPPCQTHAVCRAGPGEPSQLAARRYPCGRYRPAADGFPRPKSVVLPFDRTLWTSYRRSGRTQHVLQSQRPTDREHAGPSSGHVLQVRDGQSRNRAFPSRKDLDAGYPSMNHLNAAKDSAAVPDRSESSVAPRGLVPRFDLPNHRWMPIVELVMLAGLLAVFVGLGFWPGWRTLNSEFPDYYLAAALYHRRIPLDRIYEWTWFQRQNDHLGLRDGLVSFAPNPPTLILSLAPIATLQPLAAKRAWLVLNLAFLAVSLWVLRRVTSLGWRRLGLLSLLCLVPLHVDFLFGRHYVLVLMLICGAYYSSCLDRQRTAGAILAAAAAIKLFPALFVIMFVWKRNWRAVIGMALGVAAITALSLFMFGV